MPHLIVICIQELIELHASQIITSDLEKLRLTWETALLRTINNKKSQHDYILLRSLNLLALGLFAFVRRDCAEFVKDIKISMVKTGLGGMAGNKGGIGMSLTIHDTTMVFIGTHLAAGDKAVAERNRDYWTIVDGLDFNGKNIYAFKYAFIRNVFHIKLKTLYSSCIFWFGDLNYRLNLTTQEALSKIQQRDFEFLSRYDQLNVEQTSGNIFINFNEGQIHFDPTYKYDNGTIQYYSGEKMRVPSWTDRILFMGSQVEILNYNRTELLMSDHRPGNYDSIV